MHNGVSLPYTERSTCRLCDGPLKDIISLGDIHLSTFLDTNEYAPPKAPIDLVQCIDCDLVQLRHTVNQQVMYSEYWYQSGLNQSMVTALKDVVDRVKSRIKLRTHDVVLDIGANDGTLLKNYDNRVCKVACEPSNLARLITDPDVTVINDFFSAEAYFKATEDFGDRINIKPRVITAIAMFYDLEDPHTFVQDLADILADDGILVIQMMDLMSMIKLNDFPNLCHEHLEYYSLEVLCKLLAQHQLEIFDVEYNGVNGGSLRIYARPFGDGGEYIVDKGLFLESIIDHIRAERKFFESIDLPSYFQSKVKAVKKSVVDYIKSRNKNGERVAVLGASTKGNTILQYFGLNQRHITHAAEVNPDKYGKHTVGSNIPIIPQEESLNTHPDYYLVLPWGFIDFFVKKLRPYLDSGGKFIVPLPVARTISVENGALVERSIEHV